MSDWPHAPARRKIEAGTYIVTAGTYHKQPFFREAARLDLLQALLIDAAAEFEWDLQCWAIFSNHYHFVATCEPENVPLARMIQKIHSISAREVNRLDGAMGRQVWFRYWDTRITDQRSYFARLAYVHRNPVKHGLAAAPEMYKWCSADWFQRTADSVLVKTVLSFPTDAVRVFDDF